MDRRARIMATVGPASRDEAVLADLFAAGVDVVRLNLSHGRLEEHRETIARVRKVARAAGRHIPVMLDLMGPRYRLGEIQGRVKLAEGDTVRLGLAAGGAGKAARGMVHLPVEEEALAHLEPGERLLIDNGLIELQVEEKSGGVLTARVLTGGAVSSRKGLNLPDSDLPFTLSDKDRRDIRFAVAEQVDYLAASYVGRPVHVEAVRGELRAAGGELPIVAKLERANAVKHLDGLVEAADALMVARGDLGVEVPLHRVPVLQKQIVAAGRRLGKPVIVATQMLESMVEQPRPTRPEATVVANAVFDGADALMLSTETAAGRHPVEAVRTMARIIAEAEAWQVQGSGAAGVPRRRAADLAALATGEGDIPDIVSAAAVHAAGNLGVRWIVAFSQGGFTARLIARHRPEAGILVFTTDARVARQVQLVWGVRPLLMDADVQTLDEVVRVVEARLLADGLAAPGEAMVVLMGDPIRERPLTNLIRVSRIRASAG